MAIDLMALEPQQISKNLKGKYILLYGLPGGLYACYILSANQRG